MPPGSPTFYVLQVLFKIWIVVSTYQTSSVSSSPSDYNPISPYIYNYVFIYLLSTSDYHPISLFYDTCIYKSLWLTKDTQ